MCLFLLFCLRAPYNEFFVAVFIRNYFIGARNFSSFFSFFFVEMREFCQNDSGFKSVKSGGYEKETDNEIQKLVRAFSLQHQLFKN